jgi:hypothetical protein
MPEPLVVDPVSGVHRNDGRATYAIKAWGKMTRRVKNTRTHGEE